MSQKIMIPLVHLNGTSKQSLLDQYENAIKALEDAKEVLLKSAPNGRDYYPLEEGAYGIAFNQHVTRIGKIDSVINELASIVEEIA